jgi:hypothetical protein
MVERSFMPADPPEAEDTVEGLLAEAAEFWLPTLVAFVERAPLHDRWWLLTEITDQVSLRLDGVG